MITTKFKPCVTSVCFTVRIFSVAGTERIVISLKDIIRWKASRDLFCFITNSINTGVIHSSDFQARNDDTIVKMLYLLYTVWHFATPFLVFFSFLDSTISRYVTQISISYVTGKLRLPVFSEVAKFWKVLINFHKVITLTGFYAN